MQNYTNTHTHTHSLFHISSKSGQTRHLTFFKRQHWPQRLHLCWCSPVCLGMCVYRCVTEKCFHMPKVLKNMRIWGERKKGKRKTPLFTLMWPHHLITLKQINVSFVYTPWHNKAILAAIISYKINTINPSTETAMFSTFSVSSLQPNSFSELLVPLLFETSAFTG